MVNLDDEFGRELARRVRRPGWKVMGYGFGDSRDAALRVTGSDLVTGPHGVTFAVTTPWGSARVASPVLGRHNASNLLATLAVLLAGGISLRRAVATLTHLRSVPGRMQRLGGGPKPLVVVDYAHTPDALEQTLLALRELTAGDPSPVTRHPSRLTCVFGCGGERDRGKRPQMGRIAARLADRVIVTSDNPRGEDPQHIIDDILEGVRGVEDELAIIADRGSAVRYAVVSARRGDIVLVAGKGHEDYQLIGGVKHAYNDAAEARRALAHPR